jgi:trigger factor
VTLTIHIEEDNQRQLALTVEVPEERVDKAMREAARKLGRDIHIPGFRRGKAPYNVLLRRVGREALRAEAIDDIVPAIFEEAVEQIEAEIYAQPRLDDMELEPLVLKFTIPLQPQVDLGDYRSIRKEVEPIVITDEAVDAVLEQVRAYHEILEPVDRPAEVGDKVTVSGQGWLVPQEDEATSVEAETAAEAEVEVEPEPEERADEAVEEQPGAKGEVIFNEERADLLMESAEIFPGTPFIENIVGLSTGDEKTFTFVFPEEYEDEDLAGKEATFTITVLDVKRRELPPLDDALAKQEGPYETVAELRQGLREQLKEPAEREAQNTLLEGMIDDMLAQASLVYPPAAVEQEIDDLMANLKNQVTRAGWQWEDFLKMEGKVEEAVREDLREKAAKQLERHLVLRQFILNEKLTVKAADIDAAIEKRVAMFGHNEELRESMRGYYRGKFGFDMISSEVLMDKVHERMQAVVTGNAPDLDALAAEVDDASQDEAATIDEEEE